MNYMYGTTWMSCNNNMTAGYGEHIKWEGQPERLKPGTCSCAKYG